MDPRRWKKFCRHVIGCESFNDAERALELWNFRIQNDSHLRSFNSTLNYTKSYISTPVDVIKA
jgi:hypothetical protein